MATSRENIQLGAGQAFRVLRWTDRISEVEEITAPGEAIRLQGRGDQWHYHPQTELTLVQRGEGTRYVADHIEQFHPGDLVLIGSNVPHYWHVRGRSTGLAIQWHFPEHHGIWDFNEIASLRSLEGRARKGLHLGGHTASTIRSLMETMHRHVGLPRLTHLFSIITALTRAPDEEVRTLSARTFSLSGTDEQQDSIRRALSYIIAHYREPIRLDALLELTAMSRATFARQFQLHAGRSFSPFLNHVRLQAVCSALRDTATPITNIAFDNGFNQLSFFNRLFRREMNMSPSDYRAKASAPCVQRE
ncbi:MAG: helix-turn-helix domain-containing protein [Verrucomicrobiales bacterium]